MMRKRVTIVFREMEQRLSISIECHIGNYMESAIWIKVDTKDTIELWFHI